MENQAFSDLEGLLGSGVDTLTAMLHRRVERSGSAPALWRLSESGAWHSTDWIQYHSTVVRIAAGLRALGLAPGDRVGIMAPTSLRWDVMQQAILMARGVVVGLDPHDREDNLRAVASCCDLAGLVVQTPGAIPMFGAKCRDRLRFIVSLQPTQATGVTTFDQLEADDKTSMKAEDPPRPDDPATIIFTSGTTGAPKGIEYTHRQLCLAVAAILAAFPQVGADSRVACWLPLSNLFQRIVNAAAIGRGAQTYYVPDPRSIMRHVGIIEPDLFIAVPRFYEKLYAGIMERVDNGPSWQRRFVAWALRVGEVQARHIRSGHKPSVRDRWRHALADRLVLRRLRRVLGSRVRILVSGSAPMPLWLLERFHAMGLLILEAYGMSENAIPIAMNRPDAYRFGSVGRALTGNTLRVAEDGELWVRGPGVFDGYYGEGRESAAFDADGFLATGDFGTVDDDGFVTLTGRKSEIFKTATGRPIAPASIESVLRELPYVEHAMVLGANRPVPVAVLAVAEQGWCGPDTPNAGQDRVAAHCDRLRRDLAPRIAGLADYRRPAAAVVTAQGFSIEGGQLTANLKLRRKPVEAAFGDRIEELYRLLAANGQVPWQAERDGGRTILCSL